MEPTPKVKVASLIEVWMRAARIQGAEGFLVDMIVTCASTQTNFSSLDEARASSWTPLLKLGWHPSGKVVIKVAER